MQMGEIGTILGASPGAQPEQNEIADCRDSGIFAARAHDFDEPNSYGCP